MGRVVVACRGRADDERERFDHDLVFIEMEGDEGKSCEMNGRW